MRLGLIGLGAIGSDVLAAWQCDELGASVELVGVLVYMPKGILGKLLAVWTERDSRRVTQPV